MGFKTIAVIVGIVVIGAGAAAAYYWPVAVSVGEYAAGETPPEFQTPIVAPGKRLYRSQLFRFDVQYPEELKIREWGEADTTTITFENEETGQGFQVFVVPYTELTVSKERFKMDVPSGVYKDPVTILIDGVEATAFWSANLTLGETREVWFIKNGFLFEVTTYKDLDPWLAEIMATWRFI